METTLRALPGILTGAIRATDVMFPNGSLALVEGVYKNNPVADYFNDALAGMVAGFVEERLKQDASARIRILEVGAGTGGTSAPVLARLKSYTPHIEEYCYTDLSQAFLLHAQAVYGPDHPYLSYGIFDVEKPICRAENRCGQLRSRDRDQCAACDAEYPPHAAQRQGGAADQRPAVAQ